MVDPLEVEAVFRRCPSEHFVFALTSELVPRDMIEGQPGARDALMLGASIRRGSFNL
ncbi:hypothetical protein [Halomonas sp. ND22Bw]|uniref:hypothetical protein n=1 Tax=Halomonas sp. ND22Bw TaxID=2054178 RepID=UPI0015E65520